MRTGDKTSGQIRFQIAVLIGFALGAIGGVYLFTLGLENQPWWFFPSWDDASAIGVGVILLGYLLGTVLFAVVGGFVGFSLGLLLAAPFLAMDNAAGPGNNFAGNPVVSFFTVTLGVGGGVSWIVLLTLMTFFAGVPWRFTPVESFLEMLDLAWIELAEPEQPLRESGFNCPTNAYSQVGTMRLDSGQILFSHDGRYLFASGPTLMRIAPLFPTARGHMPRLLETGIAMPGATNGLSAAGSLIVAYGEGGPVLYDPEANAVLPYSEDNIAPSNRAGGLDYTPPMDSASLRQIAIGSKSGRALALISVLQDGIKRSVLAIANAETGETLAISGPLEDDATHLTLLPDASAAVYVDKSGQIKIFGVTRNVVTEMLSDWQDSRILSIDAHDDGKILAVLSRPNGAEDEPGLLSILCRK